jgi:hypothetical protein
MTLRSLPKEADVQARRRRIVPSRFPALATLPEAVMRLS